MHRLKSFYPLVTAAFAMLAVGSVLITGCGNSSSSEANGEDDPIAYQIGEPLDDTTQAIVVSSEYGSDTLSTADYRQQVQLLLRRIPPNQVAQQQEMVHRRLVDQFTARHVLLGETRHAGIEADTARVNMQMRQMRSQFQTEEEFQRALAASNMTADSLRKMAEARIRMQTLQEQMASEVEEPTEEDIEAYRQDQRQEEVRARHILFRIGEDAPTDAVDSARTLAQAVLDSAQAGADFATLASRHSDGPTASRGGDLGYFTKDRMVAPFADAAFALPDSGSIASEPVRTQFGFHVIQLTGRRMQELMDTSQARSSLMNERRQTALEDQRDALLAKATVHINPDVVEADLEE